MTRRSRAREVALQLLCQRDANPGVPRPAVEEFVRGRLRGDDLRSFALALYDGVCTRQPAIDGRLTVAADNWRLVRMAAVDRNVLRLGAYELVYAGGETPAEAALDEAIELAKRYGSKETPAFVNGVLDKVLRVWSAEAKPAPAGA